jgi:small subunit ribosomal protein S4
MFNTREKKERALGTKLFLKAERCGSPKCATVRRPNRPGAHGKARRQISEYGEQLREKQRFQFSYGLRESQMRLLFKEALKDPEVTGNMILSLLERRLDNAVYRLGFAASRSVARQLVSHGHILVNGRRVSIPSYRVREGDAITLKRQSKTHSAFQNLHDRLKNYEPPEWLAIDKDALSGKVVSYPKDFDLPFDVNMVVEYYAKVVK